MVEQLFGSKTRVKLLSLFLNNPGRPFYVREITRKIDEQINSVRRELANLLSVGIISSEGSNNRLYYEVNPKYEYFDQLRGIFTTMTISSGDHLMRETREEDQIAKKLRSTGSIQFAFLTGVFAREEHTNVDIFVVGDVNKTRLAKVVAEIEKDMNRELNYTSITLADYQYRLMLNDRFVTTALEAKKIVIIDGQAEKSLAHADVMFGEYQMDDSSGSEKVVIKLPVRSRKSLGRGRGN